MHPNSSPIPAEVSGMSDLERRIESNIARQRADFERQARLISDVRLDVARMRAHGRADRPTKKYGSAKIYQCIQAYAVGSTSQRGLMPSRPAVSCQVRGGL